MAAADESTFEILRGPAGVEVHLLRTGRFKTTLLEWVVEAPLDGARAARALLPDLLTRATARYPSLSALAARCEELFALELSGTAMAVGPRQIVRLGAQAVAERYAGGQPVQRAAAELLTEVWREPPLAEGRFREDHIAQERTNLVHAIDGLSDDKGVYALRRLLEIVHGSSPWALHPWGTREQASALSEPDVRVAWESLRDRSPARLFAVGDLEAEDALGLAEALVGPTRPPPPATPSPPPALPTRAVQRVVERQPLAQSKLALGLRIEPSLLRGAAAGLFGVALGGGGHSRLFKRVRERESLAYGCGASVSPDSGLLVVQAGIDADKAGRVEELVLEEVGRLAREGLAVEELELSRRSQRRRLLALPDLPGGLAHFRLAGLLLGRAHTPGAALAELEQVTPDAVAAVASTCRLDGVFLLEGTGA